MHPFPAILLFLGAHGGDPERLASYEAILAALSEGRTVHVVLYYPECRLRVGDAVMKPPESSAGLTFGAWEAFARGAVGNDRAYLTVSETRMVAHARRGPVWNYLRLRLYDDGEVELQARNILPADFSVIMDNLFTCAIDPGTGKGGASFYTD
ncbi:MAG: hypothetical protein JXB39_16995 [Deltaproteobacteria bacterium]|nr:hypothetical protein [Deltaproteobacteria bacterium]